MTEHAHYEITIKGKPYTTSFSGEEDFSFTSTPITIDSTGTYCRSASITSDSIVEGDEEFQVTIETTDEAVELIQEGSPHNN